MKEADIRPRELFDRYLELAEKDVKTYFGGCKYETRNCPVCDEKGDFAFIKKGFQYETCPFCKTLFVNPIPEKEAFVRYYRESPSTKFWATDFYKHTEEARREKSYKPKAMAVRKLLEKFVNGKYIIIDIGGGYGTFAEEVEKIGLETVVIEPNKDLQKALEEKDIRFVPKFLEETTKNDFPGGEKCFTSFELVEHLSNPRGFFENIYSLMEKEDILIFTTLNGLGLDILVLWDKSKSVCPPHHINFLNPESARKLLEKIGFSILDISTPGKLDIDILWNNKKDIEDRFWKYFLENSDEGLREEMQKFISNKKLSSHMMIAAQKK